MDGTQRIPANIFDEMAGFQEPSEKSSIIKENINESQKEPEINKKRLKLASNFFLSKIEKKLVKGFYNVAKELIKLQKKEAPFTNIKIVEDEVVSNDEEDDGFSIVKLIKKIITFIIRKAINGFIKVSNIFKSLSSWVISKAKSTASNIFKFLAKVAGKIVSKTASIAKSLAKTIARLTSAAFNHAKNFLKQIWKIVKNLFLKGKTKKKVFPNEPSPMNMSQPPLSKNKNSMKIKLKAPKKRSSFIFKAVKSIFGNVFKFFKRLINKFFGKIIKFAIKTFVKFIVRFFAMQAAGSIIPGIGNIIAGLISVGTGIATVLEVVDFVKATVKEFKSFKNENDEENVDEEERGEENDEKESLIIDNTDIDGIRGYMQKMEEQNQVSSEAYFKAKKHYLKLLSEEYKNAGDEDSAAMLISIAQSGAMPNGGTIHIGINHSEKLNFAKLETLLAETQNKFIKNKRAEQKANVFASSEIKTLLTGEEDKGPMWVSIWQNFIIYIRDNISYRLEPKIYYEICKEIISPHIYPRKYSFKIEADKRNETAEEKSARITAGEALINKNEYSYTKLVNSDFKQKEKFASVMDKANKLKFNLRSESNSYEEERKNSNFLQGCKLQKWYSIYQILNTRKQLQSV